MHIKITSKITIKFKTVSLQLKTTCLTYHYLSIAYTSGIRLNFSVLTEKVVKVS